MGDVESSGYDGSFQCFIVGEKGVVMVQMDEADGRSCALHDVLEELHAVLDRGMPLGVSALPEKRAVHIGIVDRSDDLQEPVLPFVNVRHEKERLLWASHLEPGAIGILDVRDGNRFEAHEII